MIFLESAEKPGDGFFSGGNDENGGRIDHQAPREPSLTSYLLFQIPNDRISA
jgi:hypothetical protein